MEESVWKEGVRKNASAKSLRSCNRVERGIRAEEEESILSVKGGEGKSASICRGPVKKGIYSTIQVIPDIASTFLSKERWNAENGARLSSHKSVDDKKWVSFTSHCKHTRWSRKKKGVYKIGSEVGLQQCKNQGRR